MYDDDEEEDDEEEDEDDDEDEDEDDEEEDEDEDEDSFFTVINCVTMVHVSCACRNKFRFKSNLIKSVNAR